jgi:GH15 family glucan-1,4-alpha-glucosidase
MEVRALARRSVVVIREGQSASGAYVACPTFPPYGFCWLRDGSFIADAMSRVGEIASAEAFHGWVARVVEVRLRSAGPLRLDARYTLDGEDDPVEEWPRLQHDGWGLWLWALRGHAERGGTIEPEVVRAADAVADHVAGVWHEPCTDWWEERLGVHAATLACLDAGLRAWDRDGVDLSAAEDRLDGSLLALVVLGAGGGAELVDRVADGLLGETGGVHRHADDVYYGGGEWLLLTALLGWAELLVGRPEEAGARLEWIAARATPEGWLPEQTHEHLLAPDALAFWMAKWGPSACPLLWSHAMFLTLAHELGVAR